MTTPMMNRWLDLGFNQLERQLPESLSGFFIEGLNLYAEAYSKPIAGLFWPKQKLAVHY